MELGPRLKQKVDSYQPAPDKLDQIKELPLVFLVGITGAGKNALLTRLLQKYPDDYHFIVSHTTRAPRENNGVMERDGVDYHYIDLATLEQMVDDREFVEVQVVHDPLVYGTSVGEFKKIKSEGALGISDVDIQGADSYVKMGLNAKPIFILPPNFEEWMRRFRGRYEGGKVPEKELAARLKSAVREIEHALSVDYFFIVINDDLEKTVELVHEISSSDSVDPHYPKAMDIAQHMLDQLRAELDKLA